jgi:stearoyl-CoA desaturase (delta-9 desaturase)
MPTTGPIPPKSPSDLPPDPDRVQWLKSLPFILVHLAALAAPLVAPLTWKWAGLVLATYAVRMFAITAGYHRYFSHRSYRTGRAFQFLLAALGASSAQKGPLWWAAHHRDHHRFSDGPRDVHSPVKRGFLWSHMGWILAARYDETPLDRVKDLARYPELRWLDRWHLVPTVLLAAGLFAWGGAPALFWGYFASTVLLWHCTFFINSLAHVLGRQRYETGDESRNSFLLALLTLGEGWHNNHHFYPSATNQGWFWWEIDVSYYLLRALSLVGLVRDLRTPPQRVREGRIGEGPEASAPADLDPLPG